MSKVNDLQKHRMTLNIFERIREFGYRVVKDAVEHEFVLPKRLLKTHKM